MVVWWYLVWWYGGMVGWWCGGIHVKVTVKTPMDLTYGAKGCLCRISDTKPRTNSARHADAPAQFASPVR